MTRISADASARELTVLAWHRTALRWVVVAVVAARIFTNAIGQDDVENLRQTLFDPGNLYRAYHSVNTDINKRIRYLE